MQASFAELVRSKLKVGGVLHMATDWEPYAEYMLEVMNVAPGYRNLAEDGKCVPRPTERPITKFERRGERLGHGVWDLKFEKNSPKPYAIPNVGAGLLAKTVHHSTLMLIDTTPSRASPLPHLFCVVLGDQRRSATTPINTSTTNNTGARL